MSFAGVWIIAGTDDANGTWNLSWWLYCSLDLEFARLLLLLAVPSIRSRTALFGLAFCPGGNAYAISTNSPTVILHSANSAKDTESPICFQGCCMEKLGPKLTGSPCFVADSVAVGNYDSVPSAPRWKALGQYFQCLRFTFYENHQVLDSRPAAICFLFLYIW